LGIVINGRYYHNLTRFEFDLPRGWCVRGIPGSTRNGRSLFDREETAQMPAFQAHFDQIIYSVNIP
jgi:hypothetical protein